MWTEFFLAERNSAHVLVSAKISRLLDTCLSVIHNANYIVNSIVCAVILVRGSRVPAYGIRPMHDQIHVVNMHGTRTKHIVRHSQKSVVQWSVISKFTCTYLSCFLFFRTCCWSPTDNVEGGGGGSAVYNQCRAIKTKACLFFASRGPAIRWAWTFYFFLIDAGDNS